MHYEVYSKDMLSSTTRAFGSPLRYVQGQGEFGRLPALHGALRERLRHHRRIPLSGSQRASRKGLRRKRRQVRLDILQRRVLRRRGRAHRQNSQRKRRGTVIVGAGGGKTMDTAKICADEMGLPVIIAPSSRVDRRAGQRNRGRLQARRRIYRLAQDEEERGPRARSIRKSS